MRRQAWKFEFYIPYLTYLLPGAGAQLRREHAPLPTDQCSNVCEYTAGIEHLIEENMVTALI